MDCTSQILCISYLELVVKPDTTTTIIKTFLLSSLEHVHTVVTHITICNTQDIGLCHCFLFVGKPVWWSPPTPPTSLYTSTAHFALSTHGPPPLPLSSELRHPRFQPLGARCTTTSTQSPAHHTHTHATTPLYTSTAHLPSQPAVTPLKWIATPYVLTFRV